MSIQVSLFDKRYLLYACFSLFFCGYSESAELTNECSKPPAVIKFDPQPIFDETEDDILFFHRWANKLHFTTKTFTLENEVAFFLSKCDKTREDLDELERYLRSKNYLREAEVSADDSLEKIEIKTWDNWSLLPTISFGRKGGTNTYSFGIKERNLLGLGIYAEVESFTNTQRSGYKVISTVPLYQKQNTDLTFKISDNDDGEQHAVFIEKNFAGFHTQNAYLAGLNKESREDTQFQNGENLAIYGHDISYSTLDFAWLANNNSSNLMRYRVGITQDQHEFYNRADPQDNVLVEQRPTDRKFLYPWAEIEYLAKDFHRQVNIRSIDHIEDFNYGWQFKSRLGLANGNKEHSAWLLWKAQVSKGISFTANDLLLLKVRLASDVYEDEENRVIGSINAEYFHRFDKRWGFYFSNVNVISKNQYFDRPVTMGGNTGMRGFPLQYQHGEHSAKFTTELRYYPEVNLYKLFNLAGALFADAGRTFGDSAYENIDPNWLYSLGIGARFYSPHSSGKNQIIHFDVIFPQSDDPNIDSVEIRVETKKAF